MPHIYFLGSKASPDDSPGLPKTEQNQESGLSKSTKVHR